MVTSHMGASASSTEFVLLPNRSMNWKAARAAFVGFAGFSAAIAAFFAFQGAWLVLPFAGLELVALGAALYVCVLDTHSREVIRVEADTIVVQRGRRRPTSEVRIPRAWARFVLLTDTTGWYPSRLVIRAHGRDIEIGHRLCEPERVGLAQSLIRLQPARPALRQSPGAPGAVADNPCLPAHPTAG